MNINIIYIFTYLYLVGFYKNEIVFYKKENFLDIEYLLEASLFLVL